MMFGAPPRKKAVARFSNAQQQLEHQVVDQQQRTAVGRSEHHKPREEIEPTVSCGFHRA
jgi:hypothetical protein